jgi:hypothetical protein
VNLLQLATVGLENSEDARRSFRQTLFTSEGIDKFISGVVSAMSGPACLQPCDQHIPFAPLTYIPALCSMAHTCHALLPPCPSCTLAARGYITVTPHHVTSHSHHTMSPQPDPAHPCTFFPAAPPLHPPASPYADTPQPYHRSSAPPAPPAPSFPLPHTPHTSTNPKPHPHNSQILHEETLFQLGTDGEALVAKLASRGLVPGIKVDIGLVPVPASPAEQLTQGLDGLRQRCDK